MSETALIIIVLLVIYWLFRPNSGNYHLAEKEQEIEDMAHDICRNNRNISYSEAYQNYLEFLPLLNSFKEKSTNSLAGP